MHWIQLFEISPEANVAGYPPEMDSMMAAPLLCILMMRIKLHKSSRVLMSVI